jgi:hypothetical protein
MSKDKPFFWYNRLKSLIQAKLGDKKGNRNCKIIPLQLKLLKNQDYAKNE